MVDQHKALAIAELAVYIPTIILAIIVVLRLGFHRQLGWIYLVIFCAVRIVGAVFEILHENSPTNATYIEWSGIMQSIGLSPLILATLGLLKRVIDETSDRVPGDPNGLGKVAVELLSYKFGIVKRFASKATAISRRSRLIQILQIPAMIGLILCIVGGLDEGDSDPSDQADGPKLFKAGIIIFVVIFVILLVLVVGSLSEYGKTPMEERRILLAVVVALPLLTARLVWSILSVFTTSADFNMQGGNIWTQVFMATLEEFLIVVIFTAVGFAVHRYGHSPVQASSHDMSPSGYQTAQPHYEPPPQQYYSQNHRGYQPAPRAQDESARIAAYYASQDRRARR